MQQDRRGWDGWLRRLGIQGGTPPDPAPVVLVGDERELVAAWHGPRGRCGGLASALAVARISIVAPPAGCEVLIHFSADSGELEWVHSEYRPAADLLVGSAPATAIMRNITSSDPRNAPCQTIVWTDELAVLADAQMPIDGLTLSTDAWRTKVSNIVQGGDNGAWITVAPNSLLVYVYEGSELTFGIDIREPASVSAA